MAILYDVRVHRYLMQFFLEPCVASAFSFPQVWPAAMKWAKQMLSSDHKGYAFLFGLGKGKSASFAPQ